MNNVELFIIGSGGHAKVIKETAEGLNFQAKFIVLASDHPDQIKEETFLNFYKPDEFFSCKLICGIGMVEASSQRTAVLDHFLDYSDYFTNIIHPASVVSPSSMLGKGIFIAQGAHICHKVRIEDHVIINTGAVIDHDCYVKGGSHIATGAVLSGAVTCGYNVHVGAGAIIIQGIHIADHVTVGAGAVVVKNIDQPGTKWVGVPARKIH